MVGEIWVIEVRQRHHKNRRRWRPIIYGAYTDCGSRCPAVFYERESAEKAVSDLNANCEFARYRATPYRRHDAGRRRRQ